MLPGGHRPEAADDLGQGALLEDVADCAEVHGGVEEVFFAVNRQKDDFDRQSSFLNLAGHGKAIELRHVEVEDGDGGRNCSICASAASPSSASATTLSRGSPSITNRVLGARPGDRRR